MSRKLIDLIDSLTVELEARRAMVRDGLSNLTDIRRMFSAETEEVAAEATPEETDRGEEELHETAANMSIMKGIERVMAMNAHLALDSSDIRRELRRIGLYNIKRQTILAALSKGCRDGLYEREGHGVYTWKS